MPQVRFTPFGHTVECAEGQSILRAALSHGYYLRYGCKHGGCGTCKVLVTDGDIEDSGSSFALTPAERSAGWALVCASRPLSDCVIDISAMNLTEEEFLAGDQVETFETVIDSVTDLTPTIRGVTLRLVNPAQMRFTAGQFVNVEIPGTDSVRAFSMANAPSENSTIELIVKSFPGGQFSGYLRHAEKGRMVRVFGPLGSLKVRLSYRKILMIASGSGLAPLLSMLADLTQKKDRRPVTVFFGARTPEELYYLDRLNALCSLKPQVEFVPVIEETDQAWTGETGHVTDVIDRRMGSLRGYDAYVCGPPSIVQAARELVVRLGVREANVYFDAFVPTGVEPHTGGATLATRSGRDHHVFRQKSRRHTGTAVASSATLVPERALVSRPGRVVLAATAQIRAMRSRPGAAPRGRSLLGVSRRA